MKRLAEFRARCRVDRVAGLFAFKDERLAGLGRRSAAHQHHKCVVAVALTLDMFMICAMRSGRGVERRRNTRRKRTGSGGVAQVMA